MVQPIQESEQNILSPNQVIVGKSNGLQYKIQNNLKSTNNELRYFCQLEGQGVKLVMSENKEDIMQDISTLQLLNDIKGFSLGPQLLDVDQYITPDQRCYYFYVIEYIQGRRLFNMSKQPEWVYLITLQLLDQLQYLHNKNFVSGQLVADQFILDESRSTIRYRNIVQPISIGCPLQFSVSIYDRSYWCLGSRLAEPSYDLFSLTILILHRFYCKPLQRTDAPVEQLLINIKELPLSKSFKQCLIKAIFGKYCSAVDMQTDILKTLTQKKKRALNIPAINMQQLSLPLLEINCLIVVALSSFGLSFCLI